MKALIYKLTLLVLALLTLLVVMPFASCQEDEEMKVSVVHFESTLQNVTEGSDATIVLELDRPLAEDEYLSVMLETSAIYNEHFVTEPVTTNNILRLGIVRGSASASFTIHALDNSTFGGNKYFIFTLTSPTRGLRLGMNTTLVLTLNDDEGPSVANFSSNNGAVNEDNADGLTVQIPLSTGAKGPGTIKVATDPTRYGTLFTTIPAPDNTGIIKLDVFENETEKSFTVVPVNNEFFTDNVATDFTITGTEGVVHKGNNLSYTLTIADDEEPSFAGFIQAESTVAEQSEEEIEVIISLSVPAQGSGKIAVEVDILEGFVIDQVIKEEFDYWGDYTSRVYFELPVNHGDTHVKFRLTPVDNVRCADDQTRTFTVFSASGSVRMASALTYKYHIVNDDEFATASFAEAQAFVNESDSEGLEIVVELSRPVEGASLVEVWGPDTFGASLYGTAYNTLPGMSAVQQCVPTCQDWYCYYCDTYNAYFIRLQAPHLVTNLSFKARPTNDDLRQGDRDLVFRLDYTANINGCLIAGEQSEFKLTIKDDE